MVLKPHGGYLEVVVNAENGTDRDGTAAEKDVIILQMVQTKILILQIVPPKMLRLQMVQTKMLRQVLQKTMPLLPRPEAELIRLYCLRLKPKPTCLISTSKT